MNNIDKSASNISNSIKNLSNSNVEISKSGSYNQSQVTNSNEEVNKSESFIGSSRIQSFTLSSQSQSQESFNSNHSQSIISASNSDINSLNEYLMNPDHSESMETIQNDALIFPEVADGQTLEIIQNNDFQNLLEEILESTIFNILQEANAGEFDLTKKPAFCYYKTFNNCKNIISSDSSFNLNNNVNSEN